MILINALNILQRARAEVGQFLAPTLLVKRTGPPPTLWPASPPRECVLLLAKESAFLPSGVGSTTSSAGPENSTKLTSSAASGSK